ncbi:17.2 kDa class II heat shock protein-like [Tasmannia lanceolata]|uniref:17.2 kDa class II heat shock protein-like n=1 Tax=Tasmannia lanceolata TaxID=3420 RepID=UPI004063B311
MTPDTSSYTSSGSESTVEGRIRQPEEAAFFLLLDMPRLKPNDIKMHVDNTNNVLVISGKLSEVEEEKEKEKVREKEKVGAKQLVRKFELPDNADKSALQAILRNVVLRVIVPPLKAMIIKFKM